jgi:hypothetical protein
VPCLHAHSRSRRGALALGTLVLCVSCTPDALRWRGALQYRVPAVVLAYPERGTALPADKAVVLLRFAPREADDPIDVTSFRATVDGVDRTGQFRVNSAEAWGTLGDTASASGNTPGTRVTSGPHTLGARVCSVRGACGALTVVVDVRPWERTLAPEPLTLGGPPIPNDKFTAFRVATASGSPAHANAGV